jgi:hypothetical protein
MKMTQQYIAGELSLRLGQMQSAAIDQRRAREAAYLRREAETVPLAALGSVLVRALELGYRICWDSLGHGDAMAFSRQVAMCAELREFGLCAHLLKEDLEFR